MPRRVFALLWLTITSLFIGCEKPKPEEAPPIADSGSAPAPSPRGVPITLTVAYGSEKKTWLDEQITLFQATSPVTASGRPITIDAKPMGSGEMVQAIVSGGLKPHVWSPASSLYVGLLNRAWQSRSGRAEPLSPAGEPLVLSPLVVAMWRPMAEALGWPDRPIGWSDLLKIHVDPRGWGGLGHPEWGRFKLGHTHPELSNSGLEAIVAEAYAGARKTRGITAADLDRREVEGFVSSIEETIVHYGKSTGLFADKMLERGPSYLSAAVLYENLVIESYGKKSAAPFPIVAVYPTEGTFWSDHPYAVLDAPWVGADERDAAGVFLRFLRAREAQQRALSLGFRPADPAIAIGAPIDAAHGASPSQPQTLLEVPDGATLEKLVTMWHAAKKSSDVIIVFDTSGSMAGKPLREAKAGARTFLGTLHDRDEASLVFFSTRVAPAFGPRKIGEGRDALLLRVDAQQAAGDTALYDAVAQAYDAEKERAQKTPEKIHAVVVMTDGMDEGSKLSLDALLSRIGEGEVKIFAIGYGDGADLAVLGKIAERGRGVSARGTTSTIVEVFRDMAAFF